MQTTYQRRYILAILGLELLGSLLSLGYFTQINPQPNLVWPLIGGCFISAACLWGYWIFNTRVVIHINVLLTTLFTGLLFILPESQTSIATVLFLPAAITMVMLDSIWILIVGISTYAIVLFQAPAQSPYLDPDQIISYGIIVGCLFIGGWMIELAQRQSRKSLEHARAQRDQLQTLALQTEDQAQQLQQQTEEQHQLLEILSSLQLPLIQLGKQTLLVPLVGNLDQKRLELINEQLLQTVRSKRIKNIILDISEQDTVDTALMSHIQQLIQTIQLLGSKVVLSGISAPAANSLTLQGIDLKQTQIVRSPADILEHQQEGT